MKKTLLATLILTAIGSAVFAATTTWNQEPPMPELSAQHKLLQQSVGTWEGTVTMFMPGIPETPIPAREVVTSKGPYWVHSNFTSMMGPMEYNGFGYIGYDTTQKMHVGTWMDNMTDYLSIMKGNLDKDGKTMILKWKAPDMSGKMVNQHSATVRTKDAYTMTFYAEGVKNMVIEMKRVSDKASK